MSMPQAVRHINETRLLDALFRTGAMSRADLARALGLTRATAGNLVSGLVKDGLIQEDDGEPGDRGQRTGRPGQLVRLNAAHALFLGADIGIGHLTVVALDFAAQIVGRAAARFDLGASDPGSVVDRLADLVRSVTGPLPGSVWGLGVAVPGLLHHDGTLLRAPILGWRHVPILQLLRAKVPTQIIVAENDANAFAVAEQYRAGRAAPSEAIYMLMDAGVGGGIVSRGRLLRGHDGYVGEIGHMFVGDGGHMEPAMLPGSLESFVGRQAVLANYRLQGGTGDSLADIIAAVGSGRATAMLDAWSLHLGRGIATLASVLNPQKIVLGGPVAALFPFAAERVLASMRRHLLADHPLPAIEVSKLGADGPAIGAASMMHQAMLALDEDLVFHGARPNPAGTAAAP